MTVFAPRRVACGGVPRDPPGPWTRPNSTPAAAPVRRGMSPQRPDVEQGPRRRHALAVRHRQTRSATRRTARLPHPLFITPSKVHTMNRSTRWAARTARALAGHIGPAAQHPGPCWVSTAQGRGPRRRPERRRRRPGRRAVPARRPAPRPPLRVEEYPFARPAVRHVAQTPRRRPAGPTTPTTTTQARSQADRDERGSALRRPGAVAGGRRPPLGRGAGRRLPGGGLVAAAQDTAASRP